MAEPQLPACCLAHSDNPRCWQVPQQPLCLHCQAINVGSPHDLVDSMARFLCICSWRHGAEDEWHSHDITGQKLEHLLVEKNKASLRNKLGSSTGFNFLRK